MDNTQNSALRKDIFTGTLIAQAKLLGFQTKPSQVNTAKTKSALDQQKESFFATVPKFSSPTHEKIELPEETKATFARIGERARLKFIEEQTARASKYHIPINLDHVNFLKLEQQIDEYEELLALARKQGIYWDTSIYDPLALAQALEDQDLYYRMERNDLYASFQATRGLEV